MQEYSGKTAQVHANQADASFAPADARTQSTGAIKVLKNTYALLAMTLLFSAFTAGAGMAMGMPYLGLWILLPYVIILWMVEKNKNNTSGIVWVFALTGWLGLTIAPIISAYIGAGMGPTVITALGGTAAIFFATSGYVLVTKKNLGFLQGFLITGIMVAFVAAIANVFLNIPGMGLAISSMFLVVSSGLIMWKTSEIIHGGETNYISATVTLYVMIYNIFVSLLSLLGASND